MRTIIMTPEQTEIYDKGSDSAFCDLMIDLRHAAQQAADTTGVPCEVYTADGVVVHVAEPMPSE